MRRVSVFILLALSSTGVNAADIGTEPIATGWSGAYAGLHAGVAQGDVSLFTTSSGAVPTDDDTDGWIYGVHGGYNLQMKTLVLGVEADYDAGDIGGAPDYSRYNSADGYVFSQNWQASLRARIGVAHENLLLYANGGVAWGNFTSDYWSTPTPLRNESQTQTHRGSVWGVGAEYAITSQLVLRAEYLAYDFGDQVYGYSNPAVLPANAPVTFDTQHNVVRAGFSYRF